MGVPDRARLDDGEHTDGADGVAAVVQDALGDGSLVDRAGDQVFEVHASSDERLERRLLHELGPGLGVIAEVHAADAAEGKEALKPLRVAEASKVTAEDQPIETAENPADEGAESR